MRMMKVVIKLRDVLETIVYYLSIVYHNYYHLGLKNVADYIKPWEWRDINVEYLT